jgi:adenosine deaminase
VTAGWGGKSHVNPLDAFVEGLPKAELHMHLEGSIEPELMLGLARRNDVPLQWRTAAELRAAYRFTDLQSFLDLYYAGCRVLLREQDFYDMTLAYLRRAHEDHVMRAEVFLGLQNFTLRGIDAATVMSGVLRAIDDAQDELGISAGLMIVVQRHRSEEAAFAVLDQIGPWADRIVAIGLGGAEVGNPPSRFAGFFRSCRESGFRIVIHAGEEGPASYVREAIELIGVDRIDHGIACLDDADLVRDIARQRIPLTVCPISNLRLNIVPSLERHPLKRLMDSELVVTVNSDDPSYFGAYVNSNFTACRDALGLTADDLVGLARNSFEAAFISPAEKQRHLRQIEDYVSRFGC